MANVILGNKLKHLRQLCSLTQQDAAKLMGLKSKSTISMWESGKSSPDVLSFLSLCCHYGVPEAQALVEALGLNDTAELDFSIVATDINRTSNETISEKKPYIFCPYCGEKLD